MKPLKQRSLPSWCPCVSVAVAVACLGFSVTRRDLSVHVNVTLTHHFATPFVTRCCGPPVKLMSCFFLVVLTNLGGGKVYQKWRFSQIGETGRGPKVPRSKSVHFRFVDVALRRWENCNEVTFEMIRFQTHHLWMTWLNRVVTVI